MAQVNMYVPEDIEEFIKNQAKKEGKSISAYLTHLVKERQKQQNDDWGDFLDKTFGCWEGEFPEINDPPMTAEEDEKLKW